MSWLSIDQVFQNVLQVSQALGADKCSNPQPIYTVYRSRRHSQLMLALVDLLRKGWVSQKQNSLARTLVEAFDWLLAGMLGHPWPFH